MDILRFITAGSVDDGKSTLIGRLLHDSKSLLADQLETISRQTKNKEHGEIDLALITDGLRAEREQGITIDVAYKYFSTPNRKFIVADAPGHIQYTRNLVTGASNADLILILVDARNGVVEQTKRHSIVASLLGIKHVVVAINKLDLVDYSKNVFDTITRNYEEVAAAIGLKNITFIPISAAKGDNVVEPSKNLWWYEGETLLQFLENVPVSETVQHEDARFPVQYVIRPQSTTLHDYRGYAGKVTNGIYRKGDQVTILPSGTETKIKSIELNNSEIEEAFAPQSVVLHLEDNIDISRGDLIVKSSHLPSLNNEPEALLNWMDQKPLTPGDKFLLQINNRLVKSVVKEIEYKINVNTLEKEASPEKLQLNDVARIKLKTVSPVAFDPYNNIKSSGSAILIDETSNSTVGALLIQ
jgi:sulfate adenylyltransferase subunit 1